MKAKWSGIGVVDGRGKINGTVMAKNRNGAYARVKVTGVNRRTVRQQEQRSLLSYFSQGFRSLGAELIAAWNTAAANGFTSTNIFGDIIKPTGINLYTGLNLNLRTIGGTALTSPPAQVTVQNSVACTPSVDVSDTSMLVPGETIAGLDVVPANTAWVVLASPPLSPGVTFAGTRLRIVSTFPATTDTGTTNIWNDYVDKFGVPTVGSRIVFALNAISTTSGQSGVPISASAIVAA